MSTRLITETDGDLSVAVNGETFSSWAFSGPSLFTLGERVQVKARHSRVLGRVCELVHADGRQELWRLAEQKHLTPRTGPTPMESFLDALGL